MQLVAREQRPDLLLAPTPVSIVLSKAVLQTIVYRRAARLVDGLFDVHLPTEVTLRALVLVWDDGRRYGGAMRILGAHQSGELNWLRVTR